jgi:hypothetical protein
LGTAALTYNVLLGIIVLFYFFRAYPASKAILTLDSILGLFLPAVLAKVAYCAAISPTSLLPGRRTMIFGDATAGYYFVLACCLPPILTRFVSIRKFFGEARQANPRVP